jgi:outer membrane protein
MNHLLRTSVLVTFTIISFSSVYAQEIPEEQTLSLEECVQIALDRSTRVIQGKLLRDLRDADVDQARNNFLPTLNASWGTTNAINGPRNASFIDQGTGALIQSVGESTTSGGQTVRGNLNISLFNASNFATLSAARNTHRASQLDLDASEDIVVFEAKRDYYTLLQQMSLLEVQQEQVRVSEESLRRAETLNEIGSSPISEVFSAKADLERNKATLILRENAVEIARSNLSFSLGMTADVRIVPREVEIKIEPAGLTFEKAYQIASARPGLVADKHGMFSAKDQLKATRYNLYAPSISLSGSYGWNLSNDDDFAGIEDLFLRNYSYSVGLNVSVPVFNMRTTTGVKRQKIQYLQQYETYEQSKRQLGLDVRRALLRIAQFRRSIEANEASVLAQEQDFRLQDEAYNFGAGTFLQRQQAQLNLFDARATLVGVRYDYQIQIATLEQLIGMPIAEARKP